MNDKRQQTDAATQKGRRKRKQIQYFEARRAVIQKEWSGHMYWTPTKTLSNKRSYMSTGFDSKLLLT